MSRRKMSKKITGERSREVDRWIEAHYKEYGVQEIAERFGISDSAARSRLSRILIRLGEAEKQKRLNSDESKRAYAFIRENMDKMSVAKMAAILEIKPKAVQYRKNMILQGKKIREYKQQMPGALKKYQPREYGRNTMVIVSGTFVRGLAEERSEQSMLEELSFDLMRPMEQIAEILAAAKKKGVYMMVSSYINNSQADMCRGSAETGRRVTRRC